MAGALLAGAVLLVAACADDGNDDASAQQTTQQIDEPRSQTTVRVAATQPAGDTDAPPSTPSTPATEPVVTVELTGVVVTVAAIDNSFRPELIEVGIGDEVLWENRGFNDHNVLYVDGDDWGVEVEEFGPGATYAHVFSEPGEYHYYCSIHGNETIGMVGTVVVRG